MERIRQLYSDLVASLGRLSPRERRLVALAGGAVVVFAVAILWLTIGRSLDHRAHRIETKRRQLAEIASLTVGFKAHEAQRNDLERRLKQNSVSLFTYLGELAKKQGLEIGSMNDKGGQPLSEASRISERSVEVTFTRISLPKLVQFLTEVEAGQGLVKVTHMQVRPRSDEPVLDAWLIVSTYTLES